MFKILNILIINILFAGLLSAKEPTLAILENVVSNEVQKFKISQYSFYCRPYAIVTLDKLYASSSLNSICKKSIESFYIKNPEAQYFSLNKLRVKQMYHLEFKDQRCLLFAQGERTLSELLLENGLGILKPLFEDKEYSYIFKNSQQKAKSLRRGLWSENIIRECIVELYK